MPNRTRRRRKLAIWRAYIRRCDMLIRQDPDGMGSQSLTHDFRHPIKLTPGYFRAQGWDTDNPLSGLRNGS